MATLSTKQLRHYSPPVPAFDRFRTIPRESRGEPFVKWVGSKKRLLPIYDSLLPAHFEGYFEPFLGSGAVFLYLAHVGRISRALLSDLNVELMHLYKVVRDDCERLIATLSAYDPDEESYYRIRSLDPNGLSAIERAARMMFLNRTCFNGLYRVNSKGQFNVPFGRYKKPIICNAGNLRNTSRLLQNVELQHWSFETILDLANPGDFIYLDPPYRATDASVRFTDYTAATFTDRHHGKLRDIVDALDARGCLVMLSSPDNLDARTLFSKYDIKNVAMPRLPQRNGRTRGKRAGIVIRNYA